MPPPQGTRAEEGSTGCRCLRRLLGALAALPSQTSEKQSQTTVQALQDALGKAVGASSRSLIPVLGRSGPWRAAASRAAEGRGACVRVLGRQPSPPQPQRQRLPLPKRARPVPVPGGGPSLRGGASPSPPAFPAARPPPAPFRELLPRGSRRESGSERARGRAEAVGFEAAVREGGARRHAGPPLRVCSLTPRLPHSSRSHPFPA